MAVIEAPLRERDLYPVLLNVEMRIAPLLARAPLCLFS